MPDYAEVAGVANAYANGLGHQSHTSTSPLYDSCGAYATTSLIGTTNIYHQNHYDNQHPQLQHSVHYNNVVRNGPFVYPNKKTSSTSLNTSKLDDNTEGKETREKLNNTFGGNRNNTLSYGIRNRLMKMNITENKMDILINNLGPKGSLNGSVKSIHKPSNSSQEHVSQIPPPTPNLGSTRRNQFLANGTLNASKKILFPNEAPVPIMKSYLDPETDEEEADGENVGGPEELRLSCDKVSSNGNIVNSSVGGSQNNNKHHNINSSSKSPRNKSQRQFVAGDNQSLPGKNQTPNKGAKSLNSSSSSSSPSSPYHMINHRRNGQHNSSGGTSHDPSATDCPSSNNGGNGGSNSGRSNNGTASSPPLSKKNFAGSDNQINGSPNYMKSFGKTDNV